MGERAPLSADKLEWRLTQLTAFVKTHPGLLPGSVDLPVGAPELLARLRADVSRFAHHEHAVTGQLAADSDYVALCHWNANVDSLVLARCRRRFALPPDGLGIVSEMNLGMAIWGAMSGAETEMWNEHLDELLYLFVAEVHRCGGPDLYADRLRRYTLLYAAAMGVAWLLDVPALIRKRFGADPPASPA
jgi:hypothetical protein